MASASRLAHLPVGSGYRSSFNGLVVTVFGGSGITGKLVVNMLGREGTQIVAPYRGDDYYVKDLKVCGDLGQVRLMPFHLKDEESIRKCVQYSDIVINCVGRQFNRKFSTMNMKQVNVDGVERLARISKEAGVERFIHVSALGASPDAESEFMRTKAAGEEVVRQAFPEATILRPGLPIGYYSRVFYYMRNTYRVLLGIKPVWAGKLDSIKYPVVQADLAKALVSAATQADAVGHTYELMGTDKLSVREIYDMLFASLYRLHFYMPLPESVMMALHKRHEIHIWEPFFTRDEVRRLFSTEKPTPGLPGFEELGVTPQSTKFCIVDAQRWYREPYFEKSTYEDVMYQLKQMKR